MNYSRLRKFLSYYKPYRRLLLADLACAFVVATTALLLPLGARNITQNVLAETTPDTLNQIYIIGGLMVVLVVIHVLCQYFVDYRGHSMGALTERDRRTGYA